MHFSSDIWWSSVHIRHSHARWGTSCSLCHKHTGNLVLEGLTHICFFYQLIYLIHDEIDSKGSFSCYKGYCPGDDEFLERVLITKSSRYKEGHVHAITLPCSCDNWICIFFLLNFSGKLQDWFLWCIRGLGNKRVIVIFYHDKTTYIFHSSVHPSLWSLVSWFWQ